PVVDVRLLERVQARYLRRLRPELLRKELLPAARVVRPRVDVKVAAVRDQLHVRPVLRLARRVVRAEVLLELLLLLRREARLEGVERRVERVLARRVDAARLRVLVLVVDRE